MKTLVLGALGSLLAIAPSAALAGSIVVTTPSDKTHINFTNGAASHVTSQYSAQIGDVYAAPGEHIAVTSKGIRTAESNGQTSTVTVVTK